MTTTAPAITLDQLLRHPELPNHLDKARAHLQANGYGWLLDQGAAAARDTLAHLHAYASRGGGHVHGTNPDQHPDWVRLALVATLADWIDGTANTCTHNPHPDQPQPVTAAAWRPRLVVCERCPHLLALPVNSRKNWTCDGCGYVADRANGELIWPMAIAWGLFTYRLGACAGCRYWDAPETA